MSFFIQMEAIIVFVLSIMAASILLGLPKVFKVPIFVKVLAFVNFTIDMAGGLVIYGHFGLGWPEIFRDIGTLFNLFGKGGTLIIFLYVHAVIIRKRVL